MEKRLVLELRNHNVYYIKTDTAAYYINIPKNTNNTYISIELKSKMSNYNLDMNDEIWVMENVKNTYSFIDTYNITLVLPILNEEDQSILEKMDNDRFETIDRILGKTINSAYINLKENNINTEQQIIMVNNDRYQVFLTWFTTRYQNRIIKMNLLDLIQVYNVNATEYKKLETPGMTYVVGAYNTEVDAPKTVKPAPAVETKKLTPQVSSGFTSYWFLTIITIVVASIIAIVAFLT